MSRIIHFALIGLALSAFPAFAQGRNVYVMPPGDGFTRTVSVFAVEPLQQVGTVQAATDTFMALTVPSGAKTYLIAQGISNTIVVINQSLTVTNTISLPGGAKDATLSRDGRRLIVASDTVRIFDTATDTQLASVPIGGSPTTVASSIDSTRAYAHSASGGNLAAIDLVTNALLTTTSVIGSTSNGGVAVAPTGRVYVAVFNRLFEYTPSLQPIGADGIAMNASPGRPQFTADGTRAVMINAQPVTGSAAVIVDLQNRTVSTVNLGGIPLDRLTVDSNNRAWAYSQFSSQVYQIQFNPPTITQASIPGLAATSQNQLLRATFEVPNARHTLVIFSNILSRIDNASGIANASVVVPTNTGASVAAPNSTAGISSLTAILPNQVVVPAGTAQVIARATDSAGNPLINQQVSFFTSTVGATILTPTVLTNMDGLAVTNVIAPSTTGTISITANSGTLTTNYLYNASTGGGSGGFSTVQIVSGNGQIVNSSQTAPQLLTIKVVDTQGNPVVGTLVNWSIIGEGVLANTFSSLTDGFGQATNQFTGPEVYSSFTAFKQAQITATAATGSATFYITTVPTVSQPGGSGQLVPPPSIAQLAPAFGAQLSGKIGETLTAALRYSVVTAAAFSGNQPVPNVGISIVSSNDGGGNGPTAKCLGDPLTDSTGILSCDLRIGGRPGISTLTVSIGGSASFEIILNGLPGEPAKVTAVRGDGQSGAPNTRSRTRRRWLTSAAKCRPCCYWVRRRDRFRSGARSAPYPSPSPRPSNSRRARSARSRATTNPR